MFQYQDIRKKPKLFLSMTGLRLEEFIALQTYFEQAWKDHIDREYKNRDDRERAYGGGQERLTLTNIEDKLLFILYYCKCYPLQEILAYEFGMSQPTANDWIHILAKVLKVALDNGGHLPERMPENLERALIDERETDIAIDGTERRIQRPLDNERQKNNYSGKKKTHTIKNNIIGSVNTKKVKYLSQTYEGKIHDKKIADKENPSLPDGIRLFKDTGFQGYDPLGVINLQPKKKPKGKKLSTLDKEMNSIIAKTRIIIENIICGVKRCRIVKELFRNTKDKFDDLVMEIACGLHNFRTEYRR